MKKFINQYCFYIIFFSVVILFTCWVVLVARPAKVAEWEARRVEINNFAAEHTCQPAGYLDTEYGLVRTYACDNGVFIAKDMK